MCMDRSIYPSVYKLFIYLSTCKQTSVNYVHQREKIATHDQYTHKNSVITEWQLAHLNSLINRKLEQNNETVIRVTCDMYHFKYIADENVS